MCDVLLNAVPTIIGAVIGAAVSLVSIFLTFRSNRKLSIEEHERKRAEQWEDYQFQTYFQLQEQGNLLVRATAVVYLQLKEKFANGADFKSALASDEDAEALRQCAATFHMYESRVEDDGLRRICESLRSASTEIAYKVSDGQMLERNMDLLVDRYDLFVNDIGKRLRKYQFKK